MGNQSRRDFLKVMGVTAAGVAGARNASAAGGSLEGPFVKDTDDCMMYDTTLCVGCKACVSSCKRVNAGGAPKGGFINLYDHEEQGIQPYTAEFDKDGIWDSPPHLDTTTRTVIELYKAKDKLDPQVASNRNHDKNWSFVKKQCMHCGEPGCVTACPVDAMKKDPETGIVYWTDTCCGCRYCMISCPFDVPKFEMDRPFPLLTKCDMCRDTNLKTKKQPACTEACPNEAVIYGKRKDLLEIAKKRMAAHPDLYLDHIYGDDEIGGFNYLVLSHVPLEKLGYPKLGKRNAAALCKTIQHTVYKGFIAPPVLFATLAFVAWRNGKKHE